MSKEKSNIYSNRKIDIAIDNAKASLAIENLISSLEVEDIMRAYGLGKISEKEAFRQIDEFINEKYFIDKGGK